MSGDLYRRVAALEAIKGQALAGSVIAFMINGASDDEVIAVEYLSVVTARQSGEALAETVKRARLIAPHADYPVMTFTYSDEAKARLGQNDLANAAPNSWPVPSPAGHARHVEATL